MIKTYKYRIINSCLLLILLVLSLVLFNSFKTNKQISLQYSNKLEELRSRVLLHSYYSGHSKIPKDFKVQSINGDIKLFSDVFSDLTVVLYISSNYCNSCIEDAISKMENYLIKHSEMKGIIISKGYVLRELKLMQTDKYINNIPIYSLTNDELSFLNKMSEAQYPFYFTVDNDLDISNVFFPMKSSSIIENRYFSTLNFK